MNSMTEETEALIDVHLRRIKSRAESLIPFAPGEPSAHAIKRDDETLDRVRRVADLLAQAIELMPIDNDWLYGRKETPLFKESKRASSQPEKG